MIQGRMWAQLSRVAAADAHAALDPKHTWDWTDLPRPERVIGVADWEEHDRLCEVAARCQVRACVAGWIPVDDPWRSDRDNEEMRCFDWERILG